MAHNWSPMQAIDRFGDDYTMSDRGMKIKIAVIRQVKISGPQGPLWRPVTADTDPSVRCFLGYFPSLEMATQVTWWAWIQRGKPLEDQLV